jgi:hypothetical protein
MPFISSVRGSFGAQGRFGRTSSLTTSTGGTITTAGGYRIHTFLRADTGTNFTPSGAGTVEYLVIAAGGSGGEYGGGGGAGGYLSGSTAVAATPYTITVGEGFKHPSGGNYNINGTPGGNSVFSSITATGGGGGGSWDGGANSSLDGGSGGGAEGHASGGGGGAGGVGGNGGNAGSPRPTRPGTGIVGQGFPGGTGVGGGSGTSGNGGIGLSSSITGSSVVRAGGGGGGTHLGTGGSGGSGIGGNGEGGSGPAATVKNTAATENTGSGAGGHQDDTQNSSYLKGANGIVVIRYPI